MGGGSVELALIESPPGAGMASVDRLLGERSEQQKATL